ncbi:hypothetical protein DH2020_016517 [Rehmannia glutinosa]|uniref:Protein FAR1-RELATED SEQUENCE n=1 Tax=Rehmannia glutinosa TaxID=99300 RepID=A0ABR0WRN4_REHGL
MADDAVFSPADDGFSPNSGIEITMEEGSDNSEELMDDEGEEDFEIETNDLGNEDNNQMLQVKGNDLENAIQQVLGIESVDLENDSEQSNGHENNGEQMPDIPGNDNADIAQNDHTQGKSYLPPVEGMEFESYDDAYSYYNCYAKELDLEKGNKDRCLAMIRLRLVESSRWRLDEVKLEHNHLFDHQRAQNSRSHKKMEAGAKRKLESVVDLQVQTIKLYRTPAVDAVSYGSSNEGELSNHVDSLKRLKFRNDQCKALQGAISEVFPRANHRLCLPLVMQSIREKLGEVGESEIFRTVLNRTVYNSMKVEEFEMGWEEMVQHFAIRDHEWLRSLYEDRERWVPVYLKNNFFAGIFTCQPGEYANPYFHGYLHNQMTWDEFFHTYELLQQKTTQKEALDNFESRESTPALRTRCNYELQVSQLYTKEIFSKFQEEVVLMSSCFSVTQIHANGPIVTYLVKERDADGDSIEAKNFEVVYDKVGIEVRCICSCFNFRGYLCRHALNVLNYNGIEEIPSHYILSRWRKDVKRFYNPDIGSNNIDISNPVQWYDHLYRRAMQVVTEGMASQDHHMVAWQAFKESLNKVRLASEKPS